LDEYLDVDDDDDAGALVRGASLRPRASELRGAPLHVEPVRVRIVSNDVAAVESSVERVRASLIQEYGFAPREIDVAHVDRVPGVDAAGGWALDVHGEQVESGSAPDHDTVLVESLRGAMARHLWRMLGTDDVADLLDFARLEAPATVDRVVPHKLGPELIVSTARALLRDDVPIKPFSKLIEIMGQAPHELRDTRSMVDRVRYARRRTLVDRASDADRTLRLVDVASEAAAACERLATPDSASERLRTRLDVRLRSDLEQLDLDISAAGVAVVCDQRARRAVRRVLGRLHPGVTVRGHREVEDATIGRGIHVGEGESPNRPPEPWLQGVTVSSSNDGDVLDYVSDVEVMEDHDGWNW
jgi:hypothetical protein